MRRLGAASNADWRASLCRRLLNGTMSLYPTGADEAAPSN